MSTSALKKSSVKRSTKSVSSKSIGRRVDYSVIIVGAGFGGMGAAIELKRQGYHDICILDRADDLGGTWHLNTYPGLAVDIASTTYSYSFEPNPYWSRLYAPGAELKKYAAHVADKYHLRELMDFNCAVEKTIYDEKARTWTVHIEGRDPLVCNYLIMATGFLSQPKYPDIDGLDSFQGKVIHTAHWDHDYNLHGKRAAMIGTGATAVQLLPEIAPELKHLDVHQRTPIWVLPKVDGPIPKSMQKLFAKIPMTQRTARMASSSILEAFMVLGALHNKELPMLNKGAEAMCRQHLRRQVPDKTLRKQLTPTYDFGCKRPTFSNDYYPSFQRDNVDLVTTGIKRITKSGIETVDGTVRDIDVLILATGYNVWDKGNFPAFDVYGRNGIELRDWWDKNRYQSYEGISVHGWPNLFFLAGPFSFTGLSYFFTIEGQMKHIARCMNEMRRLGADSFEVTKPAQDRFMKGMSKNMASSVFVNGNCASSNSYYFNQHGESTLLRPTPTPVALWQASHFPKSDYAYG